MTRVPVTPRVRVAPGDVVRLAASGKDYRYAAGPLRHRVVRVRLDLSQWYDGEWLWLEGVEIGPDGRDGAHRPVLARVAALPQRRESSGAVVRLRDGSWLLAEPGGLLAEYARTIGLDPATHPDAGQPVRDERAEP